MKITKSKLKQIILEEVRMILTEGDDDLQARRRAWQQEPGMSAEDMETLEKARADAEYRESGPDGGVGLAGIPRGPKGPADRSPVATLAKMTAKRDETQERLDWINAQISILQRLIAKEELAADRAG